MKNENRYPHFLCIGAQKSGTSWLFQNLRGHPGVCIPLKEVNYFNTRSDRFLLRFKQKFWRANVKRRFLPAYVLRHGWADTYWFMRYFFLRRTDAWYASLFRSCGDRLVGDLTPAYSILDPKDIRHVADIMPDARIIFLLRNPMDRAWSHLRMDHRKGWWPFSSLREKSIEDLPFDVLRLHMDGAFSTLRGDYLRTLKNWHACFPATQIFVGFFEDIQQDPVRLLDDVARFIGMKPHSGYAWPRSMERFIAQTQMQMPPEIARYLAAKYIAGLRALETSPLLASRDYVKTWRQRAEQLLA